VNTVSYTYTDGLQYVSPEELTTKFVGFGTVTTVDTEGTKEISYYHQGNESNTAMGEYMDSQLKIGREYRTEIYDKSGALARTVITRWNGGDLGSGRSMIFPQSILTRMQLGGAYDTAVGYTYDTAYGQVVRVSDLGLVNGNNDGTFTDTGSDSQTTSYGYITNGVLVRQSKATRVDQSGKVLAQSAATYDGGVLSRGLVTEEQQWIDANTVARAKTAYSSYGLPVSMTDQLGNTTTTVYDSQNLYPVSMTNAIGQTSTYTYDTMSGKPIRAVDPSGIVMEYTYDGYGRELTAKRNGIQVRQSAYSPTSTSTTNYNSGSSQSYGSLIEYDGLGRAIHSRSDKQGYMGYTYTPSGRILTHSVPSYLYHGKASNTYTYDVLGRQTVISNTQGTSYIVYSKLNKSVTNPRGIKTDYTYDVRDNLLSVVEHGQYTTRYTYDGNGNLTTLTDSEGNKREFQNNLRGDILVATDLHTGADTAYGAVKKSYDLMGRTIGVTLQDGKTITTIYDALGRVVKTVTPEETHTYVYDSCMKTKLCSVASTTGISTVYTYTPEGFIATETQTTGATALKRSYTYDNQGQVMSITQPDGTVVSYDRKIAGSNIGNIKLGGADLIQSIQYDIESRITNIVYAGNALNTTYTYDPLKMLELRNQKSVTPTGVLVDTTMTYDANGNATTITENGHAPLKSTKTYQYDPLDRMTNYGATGTPAWNETYQYSPTGNIINGNTEPYKYGPAINGLSFRLQHYKGTYREKQMTMFSNTVPRSIASKNSSLYHSSYKPVSESVQLSIYNRQLDDSALLLGALPAKGLFSGMVEGVRGTKKKNTQKQLLSTILDYIIPSAYAQESGEAGTGGTVVPPSAAPSTQPTVTSSTTCTSPQTLNTETNTCTIAIITQPSITRERQ
jgi:YD repeat-containing protein